MVKLSTGKEINIYKSLRTGRQYREEGMCHLAIEEFENIFSHVSEKEEPFLYNLILNELEITKGNSILQSKPIGLGVTLTNKCNIRCIMCGVWRDEWDIPEKTIKEIIELLPYLHRIFWQGGEVFLSPYFEGLFDNISRYSNIRQDINTNGLLIDEKWAKKLVKANANLIFSIDGITRETYEYIRRGARFDNLIKNIEMFNRYLDEDAEKTGEKKRKCSTIINLVVMKSNYRELEGFIDFANQYRFERLQITPVDIANDENIFVPGDRDAIESILNMLPRIREKAKRYGISVSNWLPPLHAFSGKDSLPGQSAKNRRQEELPPKVVKNNSISCYWPWHFLFMDWGGRVRPQCFCIEKVGNIHQNSILEIWNSWNMQLYREKLYNNTFYDWCDKRCSSGSISKEALSLDFNFLGESIDGLQK